MDFHKLKLEKFNTYNGLNMPKDFNPPLTINDSPDVYFLFVSSIEETMRALNLVQNNQKNKENRLFFVFKKGNKQFGRDHINNVVLKNKSIKRKAPMLASLSKTFSVFCFMLELS